MESIDKRISYQASKCRLDMERNENPKRMTKLGEKLGDEATECFCTVKDSILWM